MVGNVIPLDFGLGHMAKQTLQEQRLGMCFVLGLVLSPFCHYHENISQELAVPRKVRKPGACLDPTCSFVLSPQKLT